MNKLYILSGKKSWKTAIVWAENKEQAIQLFLNETGEDDLIDPYFEEIQLTEQSKIITVFDP